MERGDQALTFANPVIFADVPDPDVVHGVKSAVPDPDGLEG